MQSAHATGDAISNATRCAIDTVNAKRAHWPSNGEGHEWRVEPAAADQHEHERLPWPGRTAATTGTSATGSTAAAARAAWNGSAAAATGNESGNDESESSLQSAAAATTAAAAAATNGNESGVSKKDSSATESSSRVWPKGLRARKKTENENEAEPN